MDLPDPSKPRPPNGHDRRQDRGGALDAEQTLADSDQSVADIDQTAADVDQLGADHDQLHSDRDRHLSEADQRSSDEDQEAADNEGEASSPDPERDAARRRSQSARAVTKTERAKTAVLRAGTARNRQEVGDRREQAARSRDLAARARDLAATARDGLAAVHDDGPASKARLRAAADRAHAAADREHAAGDRWETRFERNDLRDALAEAHVDELTGTYGQAVGHSTLSAEIDRAHRLEGPLVLVSVGLGGLASGARHRRGRNPGDDTLLGIVESLHGNLRSYDPVVRLGGGRYVCGVPGIDVADARRRFGDVGSAVARSHEGATISVGFAQLAPDDTFETMLARAEADRQAAEPVAKG